jgi:hypothetical protein
MVRNFFCVLQLKTEMRSHMLLFKRAYISVEIKTVTTKEFRLSVTDKTELSL